MVDVKNIICTEYTQDKIALLVSAFQGDEGSGSGFGSSDDYADVMNSIWKAPPQIPPLIPPPLLTNSDECT